MVRTHLARNLRINIRDGVTVSGWKQEGQRIVITLAGDAAEILTADFVGDASGRSSKAKEMLEANGHGPVEEAVYNTGESYAITFFEIPDGWDNTSFCFAINGAAPLSRSGLQFAVEGNRWMCGLTGHFDEAPPRHPDAYMAFARSLPAPCIYDWISKAKQLGPIRSYNPAF